MDEPDEPRSLARASRWRGLPPVRSSWMPWLLRCSARIPAWRPCLPFANPQVWPLDSIKRRCCWYLAGRFGLRSRHRDRPGPARQSAPRLSAWLLSRRPNAWDQQPRRRGGGAHPQTQALPPRPAPLVLGSTGNPLTPLERAASDTRSLSIVWPRADYGINVSSPNTPGLRELQDEPCCGSWWNGCAVSRVSAAAGENCSGSGR